MPPYDYSENSDQTNLGSEYSSDSNKRKARDELQHISKKQKFDITFEEYSSDYMIQSPEEDIFKYPYDEEHIKSQIIYEINNKNEREALLLLENTNTISMLHSTETNPLLLAAQHGMVDIVQYCFENHLNLALISKDSTGKTTIHFACIGGHLDVVKYLTKNHNRPAV